MTNDTRTGSTPTTPTASQARAASTAHTPAATFSVLVALDGSELAAEALPVAESICARIPGSALILMRALPITPLPYSVTTIPGYIPADIYQDMVDDQDQLAQEYLDALAHDATSHGLRAQTRLELAVPATGILEVAAELGVNLIVMTTHGRTGLARFALGSVADRVVRGSATPVLLLRSFPAPSPAPTESRASIQRVLTPLDGSPFAEAPLTNILPRLAGTVIQQITLLRVVDPRAGAEAVASAERYLEETRGRLVARLGEAACSVQTLVRAGPVASTILACAHEAECGVIVMATHGASGIGRLALGSVADRVLHDGHTPLLLVRLKK